MMSEDTHRETNKLLKVVAGLLVRSKQEKVATLRDQISILSDLGLTPSEIAEILGRSGNYVSKELTQLRSRRIKRKG